MATKTVPLVLGSGGARGLAHIGVINWLDENGYTVRAIAGSSMGVLIGGIYACGKLDAYTRWVSSLQTLDVVRLLDFSYSREGGLLKGEIQSNPPRESETNKLGMLDVMTRVMDTTQQIITRFHLATCGFYEFHRARELIDIGYRKAGERLAPCQD